MKKAMKPPANVTRDVLASRVREVRRDQFGEHGGAMLAKTLDLPERTWTNYESGVTIPADVILRFVDATGVSARWLLTGQGPRYGVHGPGPDEGPGLTFGPRATGEPSRG